MNQKVTRNYLSLEELSQRTSLSVTTLRGYLKHPTHPLPHYRLPGKILVKPEEFDDWMAALDCHNSQFYNPDKPRPAHLPAVRDVFATFAAYWGWQIGVKYAQAYLSTAPLNVGDPLALVKDVVPRP